MSTTDGRVVIQIETNAAQAAKDIQQLDSSLSNLDKASQNATNALNKVHSEGMSQLKTSAQTLKNSLFELALAGDKDSTTFKNMAAELRTYQTMINEANAAVKSAISGNSAYEASLKNVGQSAKTATLDEELLARTTNALKGAFMGLIGYLGVQQLIQLGEQASQTGIYFDGLKNKFQAATLNAQAATNSFDYVKNSCQQLGLNFQTTADQFAGFEAAALRSGLTLGQVKTIFTDVSDAAVSLHLSGDKVQSVFLALEQIASKGNVQMRQLKLQLGQALPGAFEIAAQAMGVTTAQLNKLVASGQLTAQEFLPKFAEAIKENLGTEVETASQQANASFNRLQNDILFLNEAVGEQLNPELMKLANLLGSEIQNNIKGVSTNVGQLAVYIGDLTQDFVLLGKDTLKAISPLIPLFKALAATINIAVGAVTSLANSMTRVNPLLQQHKKLTMDEWKEQNTFGASLKNLKSDFAPLTKAIQDTVSGYKQHTTAVKETSNAQKLTKQQLDNLTLSHNNNTSAADKATKSYKDLKTHVTNLKTELEGLTIEHKTGTAEYKKLMAEYQKSNATLQGVNKEFSNHKTHVTATKTEYDKLGQSMNRLEDNLKTMAMKGETNTAAFKKGQATLEAYKKKVEEANNALQIHTHSYEALTSNLDLAKKNMQDLATSQGTNSKAFLDAKTSVEAYQKKLDDLDNSMHISTNSYDALNYQLEQAKTKMNILASAKVIDVTQFQNAKTEATELAKRLEKIQESTHLDTSDYDALSTKLQQAKKNLQEYLSTGGKTNTQQFADLKNSYKATASQIKKIDAETENAVGEGWGQVGDDIKSNFISAFTSSLGSGESAMERLQNFAFDVISSIAQKILTDIVNNAIEAGVGSAISSALGSLFGAGVSAAVGDVGVAAMFAAKGMAMSNGSKLTAYANGGVVSSPTMFPMAHGGTGVCGEAGDEAIMPLRRTSSGRLGVETTGQTSSNVNIYNQSSSNIETVQRPNGDWDLFVRKVNRANGDERTQGGFAKAMSRQSSKGIQAA